MLHVFLFSAQRLPFTCKVDLSVSHLCPYLKLLSLSGPLDAAPGHAPAPSTRPSHAHSSQESIGNALGADPLVTFLHIDHIAILYFLSFQALPVLYYT